MAVVKSRAVDFKITLTACTWGTACRQLVKNSTTTAVNGGLQEW